MTVPFLHTIFQSLPNRLYNLHALPNIIFTGAWGLGMPPETTQDELVLERGVFQHGSNLAILKLPPTREYVLSFKISENCTPAQYFAARRQLIEIFNVAHIANGQTSGVVPRPFVYSMTIPGYAKYNVSLVYRDGLGFDANQALDHRVFDIDVRVMSPSVTLWEDNEQLDVFHSQTSPVGGPYQKVLSVAPFTYEGSWPARFQLTFTMNGSADVIYAIRMRDLTSPFDYVFSHVNYPSGGWNITASPDGFITFDSVNEIATYTSTTPAQSINLVLAAHQNSDWRDFQFYPDNLYDFAIETSNPTLTQIVGSSPEGLNYLPRHIGI